MCECVCVLPFLFILMSGCSPGYQGGGWFVLTHLLPEQEERSNNYVFKIFVIYVILS